MAAATKTHSASSGPNEVRRDAAPSSWAGLDVGEDEDVAVLEAELESEDLLAPEPADAEALADEPEAVAVGVLVPVLVPD